MKRLRYFAILAFFGVFSACGAVAAAEPAALKEDVNEALAAFSAEMFRRVIEDEENAVISPLSAYFALAMAGLGAADETLTEFEAVLRMEIRAAAEALRGLIVHLLDVDGDTELNIANSVWFNNRFEILQVFEQDMENYFAAYAQARDFGPGAAATVDEINAWIYEETRGLIDRLIDEIDVDDLMFLINTLFVHARWEDQLQGAWVDDRNFYTADGVVIVPFLDFNHLAGLYFDRTSDFEAVLLPYNCGNLAMLVVRPTQVDIRQFVAENDLNSILDGLGHSYGVHVNMPKLDMEFEITLNQILEDMGLVQAFSEQACFPGLIGETIPPIYISEVLQNVRLLVNEEGTTAAAATSFRMILESGPLVRLNFNSPFIFAIYDLSTGIPLFMGVVDNPAAGR